MSDVRELRFGVVGMSSDHVWAMGDGLARLPGVSIVAGAEEHAELRELAARRWALEHLYRDYEDMLAREHLDAILVCTDNASKADVVDAAARRGVHVYQDKPMAATLAQAERILRSVEASGITHMVAYHTAFNSVYPQVKQLLAGGAIGQIYLARGVTGHSGPVDFGCSTHFCEWLFDRDRNGGGSFVDEACYLINSFLDNVGPVVEVSAFMTQMGIRDYLPAGVEDNAVAILRFASGALGVIDAKWGQVGPTPVRTSYHGTRGTLINSGGPVAPGTEVFLTSGQVPPAGWKWQALSVPADQGHRSLDLPRGVTPARGAGWAPPPLCGWRAPEIDGSTAGSGGAEQQYFVDRVRLGSPVMGDGSPQLARDTQEVIEAVYLAAQRGSSVSIPLRSSGSEDVS